MAQGKKTVISDEKLKEIEALASKFCTAREIVSCLDLKIKDETFIKNFGEIYEKGREQGRKKLRLWQLENAEKGNVTMQIWLGKQYLGQRETPDIDQQGNTTNVIIIERDSE